MSQNLLIVACGLFSSLSFHDVTLSEHFEISTLNPDGIGCGKNLRVVRVPFCDDFSREFVAVSGNDRPYPVLIYGMNSRQQIAHCMGHQGPIYGLTCLSSTDFSSNPKIVSGGFGDGQILVFDALKGTQLCELPNSPTYTYRILDVPEWNSHENVFVAGYPNRLFHYDLTRQRKMGSFVGHSSRVWGLGANVTENIIFSASDDETVRLWSRNDYSCQRTIHLSDRPRSCCYIEGRNLLIVGLSRGVVELFDIRRLSSDDIPLQKAKIASQGHVNDIRQIDENRFACGADKSLVVCELSLGGGLHRTTLSGGVYGVCVSPGCPISSSPVVGVLSRSEELLEENEKLRCLVKVKEREVEDLQVALRHSGEVLEEKEREAAEVSLSNERLLREKEGFQRTIQAKESEKTEAQATLEQKEVELMEIRSSEESFRNQLEADGLSTRMREFLQCLDTEGVATLDLSERYRQQGFLGFCEHVLSSSEFGLAQKTADRRFAFRDLWFFEQRDEMVLVPFDRLNEDEDDVKATSRRSQMLSIAETVVVDLFHDSSLAELVLDESDVTRDDILDLQEEWDEFYRTDPVYDTEKLMRACEETTHRKVSCVVSRIFDFFGGKVTEELVRSYNEHLRVGFDCFLGSLKRCGLGRHRSLCFKVVCDRLDIPCRLIRGWRTCSVDGLTIYEQKFADAWCIVNLCDRLHHVDLVDTGSLLNKFHPVLCEGRRRSGAVTPTINLVEFSSDYSSLRKEPLDRGGFGLVFGVEFGDGFVAVKELNLTQRIAKEGPVANARVRRELNLMNSFDHPNVVPAFGSFEFVRQSLFNRPREMAIVAIVMPFYDRNATALREILQSAHSLIALRETLFLLLSVANGLRYLHSLSILHLDMKPDNVLVNIDEEEFTLSEIRICDFGGSRPHCTLMSLSALPVSLGFCSPEVKQAAEGDKTIVLDESADLYSFGALMRFFTCYFGTFRELYELCDRCLLKEAPLRPNLIEVMSILRSHLLFVDVKCRDISPRMISEE